MKLYNKIFIVAFTVTVIVALGCNKKLQENPHTVFSTDYFKTPEGLQAGIASLYTGFRYLFGPEGATAMGVAGTDEWAMADQARAGAAGDVTQLCNYSFGPTNGQLLTPWNRSFSNINLANGLLEFAKEAPVTDAVRNVALGEIHFLRALYYLNLVQQFGAVPVDLGAGDLKFNQSPFQGFNRFPLEEVFAKDYQAIIDDLIFATQNLPDQRPANAFRLSKGAAFHLLAKAYLHRGYSAAAQSGDFQNAYNAAMEVINNQSKYGTALQTYYADVHKPKNDYNSEILFSIERVPGNYAASEVPNPQGISGTKGMDISNDFNGDYTAIRERLNSTAVQPVSNRTVTYGRPIRRFCPTPWLFNTAFADKVNDSRFEGSFRTVYIASANVTGTQGAYVVDVDTGFVVALTNAQADSLQPLKRYRVVAPRNFYLIGGSTDGSNSTGTSNFYPTLSKYEDPERGVANYPGARPMPVAKLAETYLLAAEAAMKTGNTTEAMNLINVVKRRAVNRPQLTTAQREARYNAIRLTSASQVTLDFILDERTRELAGESTRWPDLAVRGKLIDRVKLYNPDVANAIKDNHVLRPIPQSQLDRVAEDNTAQYQNPGY